MVEPIWLDEDRPPRRRINGPVARRLWAWRIRRLLTRFRGGR